MNGRMRGDAGQVAGIEAVPFGLLVLLTGSLIVAHSWAVVEAKFLTGAAAREATRAYVESSSPEQAAEAARSAVQVLGQGGGIGHRVTLDGPTEPFGRCHPGRFETEIELPTIGVPWRDDRPSRVIRSHGEEVVDPYRDGLAGSARCRGRP